jgi:hypothetical protein
VSAALQYAKTNDTWQRIGSQLAFLKESDGYFGSYLGRGSTGALHLIHVESWSGNVNPAFFDTRFEWVWSIFHGMAKLVPDFKLPMEAELRAVVQESAQLAPEALKPYLGVAGSLANLLLAISQSSGAAIGIYLAVDTDGMSPEMTADAESWGNQKKDNWAVHTRTLSGVAVDLPSRMAHGHTPTGSLDLGKFNASLRGARW